MPTLALLATGGTIAGSGPQHHYTAGVLDAATLMAGVPGLAALADWHVEQVLSLDSRDMQPAHWLLLAERIRALQADPDIAGIILTHGTDTLEETACALHWLVAPGKPLVLTAAMRPATAPSADGPGNLLDAACVALDPTAAAHGVLIVAGSRILAANRMHKAHTLRTDALRPLEDCGDAGQIIAGRAVWRSAPPAAHAPFTPAPHGALPRVDILSAFAGAPADLIDSCVEAGARGLVLALSGHGSIPADWREALARARQRGVHVVRASRIPAGGVWHGCNEDDDASGTIAAGLNPPPQARVLLMLALASLPDCSTEALRKLFGSR